ARREVAMTTPALPDDIRLESLEVGADPLIRLFLERLDLPGLFQRHLPPLPGRPPAVPSATVLGVLLANLLLARQPLYALADWARRRPTSSPRSPLLSMAKFASSRLAPTTVNVASAGFAFP